MCQMKSRFCSEGCSGSHLLRIKAEAPAVASKALRGTHPGCFSDFNRSPLAHSAPTTLASLHSRRASLSGACTGCFSYSSRVPVTSFKYLLISQALDQSTLT